MRGPCLSTIGSSTELVSDLLLSLLSELFPELSPSVECFFFFSPFPFCLDFFCAALSAFACSFFSDARSLARVCCSEVQLRISQRTQQRTWYVVITIKMQVQLVTYTIQMCSLPTSYAPKFAATSSCRATSIQRLQEVRHDSLFFLSLPWYNAHFSRAFLLTWSSISESHCRIRASGPTMSVVFRSEAYLSGRLPKMRPIDWIVYRGEIDGSALIEPRQFRRQTHFAQAHIVR